MLLRIETDNEGRNIDDLFANTTENPRLAISATRDLQLLNVPDVPLPDQHSRVMNTLRQSKLINAGLQPSLQEVLDLEGEHVIELHAGFIKHTDTDKTTNEGIAFEETLRILFFHSQELTIRRPFG